MSKRSSPRPNKRAAVLALALTGFCGAADAAGDPDPARQAELTRLVRQDCGSCHGMTLKGGLGKPLLPENLHQRDAAELADVIMEGLAGTPMPPWKSLITRADAVWIASRLKEGFPP